MSASDSSAAGFTALARFHLHVGARLALRAAAPLAGLPLAVALLQVDPGGALRAFAVWLLGGASGPGAGLSLAAVALALALWAAPRVTAGLGGWPRHLPVSGAIHRRAALVALATAQTPLAIGALLLAPLAAREEGGASLGRLLGLPVTIAAAAVASWPGERPWRGRPLAAAALLLAALPRLASLPLALVLVLAAERAAGPLRGRRPARRGRSSRLPLPLLVFARAVGPSIPGALLAGLVPVLAMTALQVNNELSSRAAAAAARLGGGIGAVFVLAALAGRLSTRRPPWPWSRSLPASASRRVAEDALLLSVPCLVPLAATAWTHAPAALAVAACLPSLALLAAAALRPCPPARAGSEAGVFVAAALVAAVVAVEPWLALAALAGTPLAWRLAASWERRLKVGRWDELHHRAVGDPLSWSAR